MISQSATCETSHLKKKVFNESNVLQWISAINSKYVPWGMSEVSKIILIELKLLEKKQGFFSK